MYFIILSQHSPLEIEERQEDLRSGWLRFEPITSLECYRRMV
jgi:hypothetical protein